MRDALRRFERRLQALLFRSASAAKVIFAICVLTGVANASTVIVALPTNLPDAIPGHDLWQVHYSVSGSFDPFAGFNLLYRSDLYSGLVLTQEPDSFAWLSTIAAPVPAISADGIAAFLSLTRSSSVELTVGFEWLGRGSPGAQPFEVFDSDFSIVERAATQVTSRQVPEPGDPALLACAAASWLLVRRRRRCGQGSG